MSANAKTALIAAVVFAVGIYLYTSGYLMFLKGSPTGTATKAVP